MASLRVKLGSISAHDALGAIGLAVGLTGDVAPEQIKAPAVRALNMWRELFSVNGLIDRLVKAGEHPEHPMADPDVVIEARNLLSRVRKTGEIWPDLREEKEEQEDPRGLIAEVVQELAAALNSTDLDLRTLVKRIIADRNEWRAEVHKRDYGLAHQAQAEEIQGLRADKLRQETVIRNIREMVTAAVDLENPDAAHLEALVEDLLRRNEELLRINEEVTRKMDGKTKALISTTKAYERVTEERNRWATRMRELENRIRHATESLMGWFSIPEIQEIRKVRGLELLPQLGEEYSVTVDGVQVTYKFPLKSRRTDADDESDDGPDIPF